MTPERDPRALSALALGVGASALGVASVIADLGWIGGLAGAAGVGAGIVGYRSGRNLASAEQRLDSQIVQLTGLETAVAEQVHARLTAEDAAQSLGAQLSIAERTRREPETSTDHIEFVAPEPAPDDTIRDAATGLYGEAYFHVAIDNRIASARRHLRPVGVVLLELVENVAADASPANPMAVADAITATLREADTACRLDDGRFALVLEDTPETGAIWTVERIRRRIADTYPGVTMWAGVACYPAHAFDRDALMTQANRALGIAKDWRQDRIEVASGE